MKRWKRRYKAVTFAKNGTDSNRNQRVEINPLEFTQINYHTWEREILAEGVS